MKSQIILHEIEDWEKLKNRNDENSLIIFKYSPFCSISRGIERDINSWAAKMQDSAPLILAEVDVISSRDVSQTIAADLRIRHESPQIIILDKDGKAVWHESHYFISIENIEKHLTHLHGKNAADEANSN